MNKQQIPAYEAHAMSKDDFYYAYHQLAQGEEAHVLLESGRDGKQSIAGVKPLAQLQVVDGDVLHITWRDGREELVEGNPLENLMQFVEAFNIDADEALPAFQGGVIGFISYDYARRYLSLPDETKTVMETPDLHFYLFDEWVVFDHEKQMAYFMVLPDRGIDVERVVEKWMEASRKAERNAFSLEETSVTEEDLNVSVTGPEFEQMVRDVQAYIEKGDVTQVNLSVRQSKQMSVSPMALYETLRQVNPSPYMASIGAKEFAVASSSPELLLKRRGSLIETRPIGGTRKRGLTEAEDKVNEQDLLTDEKEKEEHRLLVELEKEDFSRVCKAGSVETNEFMVVERYSHVMHLVSNIRGLVAENITNADIVKAVFPGGTITGAPKVRTMEIIEELEPEKRGLYTGSIGWFGFNGDFELNVVIRTAFIQKGIVHIQAGAGLVAESVPGKEYIESLAKGEALWKAKRIAEKYNE